MAPAIELIGVGKRFGAVRANRDVNLAAAAGSIHGIIGENGAGKSTLMSILYGFYESDEGEIRVDGKPARIRSPADAIAAGIGMVHQHFMLVETLSVLENVMLGVEGGPLLARGAAAMRERLAALGRDYGLDVDPDAIVGDLAVGPRQRVELIKALARGARILILDEPTAVLTPSEADGLFAMLDMLRRQGRTVLFITHKLREIMALTDRVSVMRRGAIVGCFETRATTPAELASAMVGRPVLLKVEKTPAAPGAIVLETRDLVARDAQGVTRVDRVSLTVRAGEIVGIAGVSGNGQSELLAAIAGILPASGGSVRLGGEEALGLDPRELRRRGLAHVPEDRHHLGLVLPFEESENAILGYQDDAKYAAAGPILSVAAIRGDARARIAEYDIQPPDCRMKTANFSGGNQQKIVLAREMERDPKALVVGQPTRGVDIGAIEFIHRRLIAMRDAGKAILLVSVELEEILALSDRILVMCGGRIAGERRPEETDAQDLGLLMAGVTERAA